MDAYNIQFHLTNGDKGYPAGGFYSSVMDLVFGYGSLGVYGKGHIGMNIFKMCTSADGNNSWLLRQGLPEVWSLSKKFQEHEISLDEFDQALMQMSTVIPGLLVAALPDLSQAMREYAQLALYGKLV